MKKESIKRGSIVTSILNIIARSLGFISVFLVSYYFGANATTDLYYYLTSFTALFSILFICLQPTVLMPLFIKTKIQLGEDRAWLFINSIFTYTLITISLFGFIFFIFSDVLLLKYSHFTLKEINTSSYLIILFAPIIILTVISEFFRSLIQTHHQFTFPSVILLLSNVFMIFALVLGAKKIGVLSMTISVLVSLIFQCIVMIFYIKKAAPKFGISFKYVTELKEFLILSFPVLIAQIFASISMFYYDYTSTLFTAGTLTAISFSQKIFSLPNDMVVTPMSNVISPLFSEHNALNNQKKLANDFIKFNGIIWFFVIPVSIFFIIFSTPIIELLFFRGNFSKESVATASLSLRIFSASLFGLSFVSIYTRVLYSIQKTKLISMLAILISILSVFSTYFLSRYIGFLGIPLTRTLSVLILSVVPGVFFLKKYLAYFSIKKFIFSFFKISISAIIAIIVSYLLYYTLFSKLTIDNLTLTLILKLSASLIIYILIYVLISLILKTEEGGFIFKVIKNK